MTKLDPKKPPPDELPGGGLHMAEDEFQRYVMHAAHWHRWRCVHFRKVRMPTGKWVTPMSGDPGFPDLALARDGVVLLVELKTNVGDLSKDQQGWLTAAGLRGQCWRPLCWRGILDMLERPTVP